MTGATSDTFSSNVPASSPAYLWDGSCSGGAAARSSIPKASPMTSVTGKVHPFRRHTHMRRITLIAAVAAAMLASPAAAAQPPTPSQASGRIGACLKQAYVAKIAIRADGGTVYFAKPFSLAGRWTSWSYATRNGRVAGIATAHGKVTAADRRTANRCLRPFGGRI